MKILAVSLMRLGDIIMTAPVLRALRCQFPSGEIHMWIQHSFRHVREILPEVDVWHFFERTAILESFQSRDHHLFMGYDLIKEQLHDLNRLNFDLVCNLTNTKLSAILAGAVESRIQVGVMRSLNGKFVSHGTAFKLFNDNPNHRVHFMDLLWKGCGFLGACQVPADLFAHPAPSPLESRRSSGGQCFLFQITTSDSKKAWPLENWKKVMSELHTRHPEAVFSILCAPSEESELRPIVENWKSENLSVDLLSATLKESVQIIRGHTQFLTLDTATKHLAMGSSTHVLELDLGSSQPWQTGLYQNDARILSGRAPCSPCSHRARCPQPTHLCAESISPGEVVECLLERPSQNLMKVRIADEVGFRLVPMQPSTYTTEETFQ